MSDLQPLKVPALPESVSDATVAVIHKRAGEAFERDEVLIELETDKVLLEVPAPEAGVMAELEVAVDDTVVAGQTLAQYRAGSAAMEAADRPHPEPATSEASPPDRENRAAPVAGPAAPEPHAGPGARRAAAEQGVDLATVEGSGPRGRITSADVTAATPRAQTSTSARTETQAPAAIQAPSERREPMTRIRKRIAERLVEAQRTAAMLTTFNEVDMSAVMALRRRHQEAFVERHGVKLGLMSAFVKAAASALAAYPMLNARIDGDDIVHPDGVHIGIAVATPRGLIVPVVRHADRLGFAAIEQAIRDFAERGRDGRVTLEEMQGGTFSITNGGVFGSLLSTPILNAPQSAILGMHAIQERPVARDGEVVIRPMMYVALSYDHRLIDGEQAVRFLVHIKESLEDPARLLLDL